MTRIEEERIDETALVNYLWQEFCELPDRSSPDEYPDMALVSLSELTAIVETYFERSPELKELRAQGGVTVRPLEWTAIMAPRSNEDPSMEETGDFDAETPFGAYTIDMGFGSDEYTWSLYFEGVSVDGVRGADDPEKLKDAAFADYRNRILSALETEAVEP